jgi:hypothetical protein
MRHKITTVLLGLAILQGIALGSTVIAQEPASPAQIGAWESQKAALQAQQQAAQNEQAALPGRIQNIQAEIARLEGILNGPLDMVQNPVGAAVVVGGKSVLQGANPIDNRTLEQRAMDNAWVAIQQRNATRDLRDQKRAELAGLQARQAQLGGEIAARNDQIAQLDRTIAYYRNPRQADLDNERARLKNLDAQKPTHDDGGQLGWDIDNTKKRIKDLDALQQQFQQGRGSPSGASSGQSQGPYAAPGTGPQSQLPPGYDSSWGPTVSGSQMPNYQDLQQGLQPQQPHGQGSSATGGKKGGSSGGIGSGGSKGQPAPCPPGKAREASEPEKGCH